MIAVRGCIVPTPTRLARGRPERNGQCEACGTSATLNHIQQKCMRTHGARITRHDRIVDLVCDGLTRRGWEVDREIRLNVPSRTVIPDVVARLGVRTIILDVTVVGDQLDLEQAALAKVEKYSGDDIASQVLVGGGGGGPRPSPSVCMASRGTGMVLWLKFPTEHSRELGFSRSFMALSCLRAVSGSKHIVQFYQRTTFQAYWEDGADEGTPWPSRRGGATEATPTRILSLILSGGSQPPPCI